MSTTKCLVKLAGVILVLQALWTAADAQNLSVTGAADDYVIQNQRQYAANILNMEAQLATYKASYDEQLSTITLQSGLLETKLIEVEQRLNPLELLDTLSKHCVQKYRSRITTVATVKATLSSCVATATSSYTTYVSTPTTTMTNLKNYYNNQLVTALSDCKKKFENAQLNYTLCATQTISSANTYTISMMKTFDTQMQTSQCSGDGRIKLALDCSFTAFYSTISLIGESTRLIDNCIAGLEYCPPCDNGYYCNRDLDIKMSSTDFTNSTITNPFYGLNSNSTCVKVFFV